MAKLTRRAALAALATGGGLLVWDTSCAALSTCPRATQDRASVA